MLKLANTLENLGIKFIWYVFTTDEYKNNPIWLNKNVIHIKNRLDIGSFIKKADWYVQLSICEGDSYSLKEALYRGTPIVVCELPYFKEIGIKDNENALFYKEDNSNVKDVAERMKKPLKFIFKPIKDGYEDILYKSKSKYEEERKMMYLVRATNKYKEKSTSDAELSQKYNTRYIPEENEEWQVDFERKEKLIALGYVTVVKEIKEEEPVKKTTKKTTTKKSKK